MLRLHQEAIEVGQPEARHVTDEELSTFKKEVPDWEVISIDNISRLQRVYPFDNFLDAMVFGNKVGELGEKHGHHPAVLIEWGKCTITWWSHDMGGLHKNDFILAAKSDQLF